MITRLQPGTLAIAGGPCALSERRLEPDISPNRRNSFLDTGALMVRLTEPRPELSCAAVGNCCMSAPTSARILAADSSLISRNALEQMKCSSQGWAFHAPSDLAVERFNLIVQKLQVLKRMSNEKALMVAQPMISNGGSNLRNLHPCFFLPSWQSVPHSPTATKSSPTKVCIGTAKTKEQSQQRVTTCPQEWSLKTVPLIRKGASATHQWQES